MMIQSTMAATDRQITSFNSIILKRWKRILSYQNRNQEMVTSQQMVCLWSKAMTSRRPINLIYALRRVVAALTPVPETS